MLAGVEWQVEENGTLYRATRRGTARMTVVHTPTVGYSGGIEIADAPRLYALSQTFHTDAFAKQLDAAEAVLLFARESAAELLALAGKS